MNWRKSFPLSAAAAVAAFSTGAWVLASSPSEATTPSHAVTRADDGKAGAAAAATAGLASRRCPAVLRHDIELRRASGSVYGAKRTAELTSGGWPQGPMQAAVFLASHENHDVERWVPLNRR